MSNKGPEKPPWFVLGKGLALLTQLGIQIIIPIVAGVMAGSYMERRTGSLIWAPAGILLGILAGLWSGFRMVWDYFVDSKDEDNAK